VAKKTVLDLIETLDFHELPIPDELLLSDNEDETPAFMEALADALKRVMIIRSPRKVSPRKLISRTYPHYGRAYPSTPTPSRFISKPRAFAKTADVEDPQLFTMNTGKVASHDGPVGHSEGATFDTTLNNPTMELLSQPPAPPGTIIVTSHRSLLPSPTPPSKIGPEDEIVISNFLKTQPSMQRERLRLGGHDTQSYKKRLQLLREFTPVFEHRMYPFN
jgi:hypothetical protein